MARALTPLFALLLFAQIALLPQVAAERADAAATQRRTALDSSRVAPGDTLGAAGRPADSTARVVRPILLH